MRWYCKFCKLFTEVDLTFVCNYCQSKNKIFDYIKDDDDTKIIHSPININIIKEDWE